MIFFSWYKSLLDFTDNTDNRQNFGNRFFHVTSRAHGHAAENAHFQQVL